jgi:hypothetical protein
MRMRPERTNKHAKNKGAFQRMLSPLDLIGDRHNRRLESNPRRTEEASQARSRPIVDLEVLRTTLLQVTSASEPGLNILPLSGI